MVANTSPLTRSRQDRPTYPSPSTKGGPSSSKRQQPTYGKRGSFGCTREVLHPLDPQAEPTAILYYDSSSDDEYEECQKTLTTPNRKPMLIGRESAKPDINVQSPGTPASAPFSPSPDLSQSFLSRFSAVGISDTPRDQGRALFQTPERLSSSPAQRSSPQMTVNKERILNSIKDWGEEALMNGMHEFLEEVENEPECTPLRELIVRVEAFIETLQKFASTKSKIDYVIDQCSKYNILPENKAVRLKNKCKNTAKMTATEILCRWLVYDKIYRDESISVEDSTPSRFQTVLSQNIGSCPSRKTYFNFRSSINPRITKSPFAENLASWEEKLRRLRDSADAISETLKENARREHENSAKYLIEQYKIGYTRTKEEVSLEYRLQKLLDERRHYEHLILQAEEEKKRQERARRKAEEEARKWAVEAEIAKKQAEEEAKKRAEAERQRQAEAARIQRQKEEAERKREAEAKAAEEVARKRQEELKKAEQAKAASQAAAAAGVATSAEPRQYGRKSLEFETAGQLQLLEKLKWIKKIVAADRELFKKVNAVKRALNPKLGQLTGEVAQTTAVRTFIFDRLSELFMSDEGPKIEASLFQLSRNLQAPTSTSESTKVPVIFIWMVNELGKMVVRQVETESSVDVKTANPIGVCTVSALSRPPLIVDGYTFVDIVVARLWKKCPIIQGVLGPENTAEQREALGWKREGDVWEAEEAHINRMNGYVAGFASIAGRNFMKSKMINPYPPFNLWFLLAYFANNPNKLTNTHYCCIKTIVEVAGDTIRTVYKTPGMKLIHIILTDLANYGVQRSMSGAVGLQALKSKFDKEGKFL